MAFPTPPALPPDLTKKLLTPSWRLKNLYNIRTKDGRISLFEPNPAQFDYLKQETPRDIILKARQLGFSTLKLLTYLDRTLFTPNTTTCIMAHRKETMERLFRMIKFAYDMYPRDIPKLPAKYDNKNELFFPDFNSTIYVSLEARGDTIHNLHVCLSGSTPVFGRNGYVKPIKDWSPCDWVLNSNGSYSQVVGLSKTKLEDLGKSMLAISVSGQYEPLKLTQNHKVLTRKFVTGKPFWKKAEEVKNGDYLAFPIRNPHGRPNSEFPDVSDFDFGTLLGFYVAEGSARRYDVTFSIHRKETEWLLDFLKKFENHFNSIRVSDCKTSLTTMVTVNGKEFRDVLLKFCGSGKEKFFSDSIWSRTSSFMKGIVYGYFLGDGSLLNTSEVSIVSIRRQTIDQLKMILISLRYGVASIYYRPAGSFYGRNCQEIWTLKLMGEGNWKMRKEFGWELPKINTGRGLSRLKIGHNPCGRKFWRRGKDYYWSRVVKVEQAPPEEFVYDLILDQEPHAYVTTNGVVHNSELAHMDNAEDRLISSIAAVPPNGRISIESTANGVGDYFYDFYHSAPSRGFKRFFYPWTFAKEYEMDPIGVEFTNEDRQYQSVHSLTERQLAWWKMQKSLFKDKFPQEYPITPQEAFLSSGNNIFPIDYLDNAVLPKPIVDSAGLQIWKHPHYHHSYSMGVDVSEGSGGDEHSIDIIDCNTGEQVLHWSGQCTVPLLSEKVEEYAHRYNEAFLVPEANNHGFSLIYLLDEKRLNIYKREKFDMGQAAKRVEKLGWLTTKRTKPLMIQQMIRAMYESDVKIYCQKTVEQMRTFLNLPDGSMGAAPGKHDDCVMSLCLAWQGLRVSPSKKLQPFSIFEDEPNPRVREFYGQVSY